MCLGGFREQKVPMGLLCANLGVVQPKMRRGERGKRTKVVSFCHGPEDIRIMRTRFSNIAMAWRGK